ncbi:MAG: D-tyrosyl-tRNA(Tyr) deacylase [Candidatus Aminicenantes bacterium]|nr:D-tyrosyl-tRNA(Tyr) deacylase [Candidatus Aminicenantes bacterium]
MKIVLQRVKSAHVITRQGTSGKIGKGLCLLVGIEKGDTQDDARYLAEKISGLRVFSDDEGKMNLSIKEAGGDILAISQFTLAGSVKKGRRPSFDKAEKPEIAQRLFDFFVQRLQQHNIHTETGIFGAWMEISLVNDGPVTFILSA